MVEVEVRKLEAGTEKATAVNLDVNDIISKVRDFVDSIKGTSLSGQRMTVDVEGFKFSLGKSDKQYDLSLSVSMSFKPKDSKAVEAEPL